MRKQRLFAVFTAISASMMMFSCTAVLGVTDVPDVASDVDANEPTGDSAEVDANNETGITDAEISGSSCLASCELTFSIEVLNASAMATDGGMQLTLAPDASLTNYTLDFGDAAATVTSAGIVQQNVRVRHSLLRFSAFAYNAFYNGYLTTGDCDGGTELDLTAAIELAVNVDLGQDAAGIGCDPIGNVVTADNDASMSDVIASQLHVCYLGTPASPPAGQVTPGVINGAAAMLELDYQSHLAQAFTTQNCVDSDR